MVQEINVPLGLLAVLVRLVLLRRRQSPLVAWDVTRLGSESCSGPTRSRSVGDMPLPAAVRVQKLFCSSYAQHRSSISNATRHQIGARSQVAASSEIREGC